MSLLKSTINSYILPFSQENPYAIVNLFSMDNTGLAGQFVSIARSNPSDLSATFSAGSVGVDYAGITSLRPEVKNKITAAPTGSTKYQVLGITLDSTLERDANGITLRYDRQRAKELHAVVSGEAVRVAHEGIYMLRSGAYIGTPKVGDVGIIQTTAGVINVVDPKTIGPHVTGTFWNDTHVLGKFLSTTGVGFGSTYALFQLSLS